MRNSDDGGKTFRDDGARNIHVDHHAMWIDPNNPNHLIIGNDGGVSISDDRAATWVWMSNLPFAQAYHVTHDMQTPKGSIMSSTSLPTDVQVRQKRELEAAWPKVAAEASAAIGKLAALARDVVNAVFGARISSPQ